MKLESRSPARVVCTFFAALSVDGCCNQMRTVYTPRYEFVAVEYASGVATTAPPAEVRPTETYTTRRTSIRAVSIRFPDSCITETASQATGVGASTRVILRSDCAVWLAELERSLAAANYRVLSWDALYRAERATTPPTSTYVAARTLGADAVFMINSLETSEVQRGARFSGSLTYYQSNARGDRIALREFDDNARTVFQTMVRNRLGIGGPGPNGAPVAQALAGVLDATAVVSGSGESMWFYRRNVTRRLAAAQNIRFLFMGGGQLWRPVARDLPQVADVRQVRSSARDTFGDETSAGNVDPLAAERHAMVRMVVEDFVRQFKGEG